MCAHKQLMLGCIAGGFSIRCGPLHVGELLFKLIFLLIKTACNTEQACKQMQHVQRQMCVSETTLSSA